LQAIALNLLHHDRVLLHSLSRGDIRMIQRREAPELYVEARDSIPVTKTFMF
jgi:hypothetical protein